MNTCREINEQRQQGNSKNMFNSIRALQQNNFKPALRVLKDKKGNTLTEKTDILHRWKEYCQEMYKGTTQSSK